LNFSLEHAWTGPSFPFDSPRDWQARALPIAVEALSSGRSSIVRAIMGSGKAALAAELCYVSSPDVSSETIVVSAPTRNLVDQLSETISNRLGDQYVGKYYTDAKQSDRPIVVACLDSLPSLARDLLAASRTVPLWIADEVHRTETETVSVFLDAIQPEKRIGLTATPFLGGSGGLERWDEIVFNYSVAEALEDKVIVPWRLESWTASEISLDIAALELAKKGRELGPGVINATTIADAEEFKSLCHEYGLRTETVHSAKKKTENAGTLSRLQSGDLDAVIHVSMLQEGVDLPWLRWILLRRNTSSKVRFAQEVGRVLRAHPGKDFATVYDPLDLFDSYKLTLEAVLSGGTTDGKVDDREPVEAAADDVIEQLELDIPPEERTVRALKPCEAYLRRVVMTLDAAGILDQKVASSSMRRDPPSLKQLGYVKKLRNVLLDRTVIPELPDRHRDLLEFARRQAPQMSRGVSSDLISILVGLRRAKTWPKIAEIMT
jgi:superfamily II DNA or RNA helicase